MARRTKAKKNEVAQTQVTAPDFSFEDSNLKVGSAETIGGLGANVQSSIDALSGMVDDNLFDENLFDESLIDLDDLAKQIALATEELTVEDAPKEEITFTPSRKNIPFSKGSRAFKANEAQTTSTAKVENTLKNPAVDESIAEQLFGQKPANDVSKSTPGGTVSTPLLTKQPRPANDDATTASTRRILLQKPASRMYWTTTALSALWAAGGAFVAGKLMPAGIGSLGSFAITPTGMAVAAGTVIPILMLWGFAQLTKRSRELQNIANLVSDAAIRLSATENNSEEQLATLGQTVRREVAAMSEGIERTLARAVELEALIQGEVNNLERAYAENETRIHTLISELSNEREAILSHADRVQSTIRGTQSQLSSEFGSITSNIAANVQNVAQTLSQTLQLQGEDLIGRLSQVSEGVSEDLSEKFQQTAANIQNRNKELFEEMEERFNVAADRFDSNGRAIIETLNLGSAETEERAIEAAIRMQEATELALSSFDEKFQSLDEILNNRSNQSIAQFHEKISDLDSKSSQLTSHFDKATTAAIEAFERRLAEVDTSLGERSSSIIHSFIARAQALEENTEKLGHFLDAHTNQINDTLKERTIDIANTFNSNRDEMLVAMEDSKASFAQDVNNINLSISDIIKERTEEFTDQLTTGHEIISEMLVGKTDKLVQTVQSQIEFLSKHVSDIETLLVKNISVFDEHASEHVINIDERTVVLQQSIEKSFETAKQVLDAQADNIDARADALRDSLTVNSAALNEVLVDQARVIEQRIDHIREILNQGDYHFGEALTQQISLVENAITSNNESLRDTFSAHLESISNRTQELKLTLDDSKGTLLETIDDRIDNFNDALRIKSLEISERATLLEENLSRTLHDVNYSLENQANVLTDRSNDLQFVIERNNEFIKEKFFEQTSTLDEHTQIMQNTIERSVHSVKEAFDNSTVTLSGNLIDNLVAVQETLNEEAQKAGSIIMNASSNLLTGLNDETDKVANILANAGNQVINSLGEETLKMRSTINILGDELANSFNDITSKAQSVLSSSGDRIAETISAESAYFDQTIAAAGNQIASNLHEQTNNAVLILSEAGQNFQAAFTDELVKAEEIINEQSFKLTEALGASAANIEQSLADRSILLSETIQQFQNNIYGQLDGISDNLTNASKEASSQIVEQIDQLSNISKNLSHAAQKTGSSFGKLSSHITEQINVATKDAEDRIHEQNEALINAFAQRSSDTLQAVTSVKENLIENVSVLLGQIDTSTDSINVNARQLIGSIQNIDEHFAETARFFHKNSTQISSTIMSSNESLNTHVELMQGVYNNAFEKMNYISQNFEQHATLLDQAVRALDSLQESFSSNIEDKQHSLMHLTQDIATKSSDIAQIIEHYEEVIGSALARTDHNARSSAAQLQNDFEQMVANAIARFSQATKEIQRSSYEIKSELEKTNSELSVSMRILPTQTKEATSAIRHAVADQVKALQDLSKIIEKNSKTLAISQPAQLNAAQIQSMMHVNEQVASSNKRENVMTAQADMNDRSKDGWVSNLLARASRDEGGAVATMTKPTRSPAMSNDSLNSLSSDIVRAIDNRAITDLWSNYRRGRRNINPQALYTPTGQLTFDRIKQKCASDQDFRRSVIQYITDFEKLLREMNQNGASKDAVRHYLTSDTGKVYTMLAHVNGRIQ